MKKLTVLVLMTVLAIALCACGAKTEEASEASAPATPSENAKTIGISIPSNSMERFYNDGRYLEEQFKAAGYDVVMKFTDAESNQQDEDIRQMIENGADLLVILADDSDGLSQAMAEAKEKGIPVVAYDRFINNSDAVNAYVSFDNYAVGALQGSYVRDALDLNNANGPFNIEFAAGSPDDTNAAYYYKGAIDVLQPYIDAGKLQVRSGQTSFEQAATPQWDTDKARSRFESILASHYSDGAVLDAVLCSNDSVALGVTQALANGYTGGNAPVITGQDANIDNLHNIVDGKQAMTVYKNVADEAAVAFEVSKTILEGGALDGSLVGSLPAEASFDNETYNNGAMAVPAYLLVPSIITADNLESLAETGQYQWDANHTYLEAAN